jgi:hypothetical protein
MTDTHKDPFDDDQFDQFSDDDQFPSAGDDFDDQPHGLTDEFETPAEANPVQTAAAEKPSKPLKAKKVSPSNAAPKPFIKTWIGIGSIAFAVAMVSFIGYKGASSVFSTAAPGQVETAQVVIPHASEPVIGNVAGLVKPQASPEVVQAVQAVRPQAIEQIAPAPLPVAQAVDSEELKALKESISDLKGQTSDIKELLRGINKSLERQEAAQNSLINSVSEMKADLAKQVPPPAPVVVASAAPAVTVTAGKSATEAQPAVNTRQRISGLQVIETSQGGAMSIIKKASNGRVFTLFKGETLNWAGVKSQVTSIEKDGDLVLVGDKYFIDNVLETPKVTEKVAAPASSPVERRAAPVREAKPVAPKNAEGYSLNAVYNGKSAFGIVNNKGEFKSYKIGDSIDNLGVITGLDEAGNLKVGSTVIKTVY